MSKNFYFGVEKGQAQSEKFITKVKSIGFIVISKEVKWTPVSLTSSHFKKVIKKLFNVFNDIQENNQKLFSKLKKTDLSDHHFRFVNKNKIDEVHKLFRDFELSLKETDKNINFLKTNLKSQILRRKCDFDVEITRDALSLIDNYKIFMLWSGDGDYAALTEYLLKRGKRVIIVFAPGHKGKEYDNIINDIRRGALKASLFMFSVNSLKNILQK